MEEVTGAMPNVHGDCVGNVRAVEWCVTHQRPFMACGLAAALERAERERAWATEVYEIACQDREVLRKEKEQAEAEVARLRGRLQHVCTKCGYITVSQALTPPTEGR